MAKAIRIPGSTTGPADAAQDLSTGAFSTNERAMIAQLINWWRNRITQQDSRTPEASLIGGLDVIHTATTTGTTPTTVTESNLLTTSLGASYFIHAFGIPSDPAAAGEVYSLLGIAHYYPSSAGILSRYTTLGRAIDSTTSTEIRTAVSGTHPNQTPSLIIVGVSGLTITWRVALYKLEYPIT